VSESSTLPPLKSTSAHNSPVTTSVRGTSPRTSKTAERPFSRGAAPKTPTTPSNHDSRPLVPSSSSRFQDIEEKMRGGRAGEEGKPAKPNTGPVGGMFSHLKPKVKPRTARASMQPTKYPLNKEYPSLDDFEVQMTVGTGGFGRVKLVKHKKTGKHLALKILKKHEIVRQQQVEHVLSERSILESVAHPYIIRLHSTYQDPYYIYMLMDYVAGGDFFSHLRAARRFPPETAKHYIACIVLALDYVHSKNVIYRDLKPENLLLDEKGRIKITDFGLAKRTADRTWTVCGTPEYLAPEIILTKGHGKAVDWWALGALMFEFLAGYPPFYDENPFIIYQKILKGTVEFPRHFDEAGKDLVKKLLVADLTKRFGGLKAGVQDIMDHRFFHGIDFDAMAAGTVASPIIPMVSHDGDTRNFDIFPEDDERPPKVTDDIFKGF